MAESTLAQDFIAGVDPFGIYTSQYGQQAEQAGVSEGRHRTKRLAGIAGGVTGGAVLVPTVTSGLAKGLMEAARGGGSLGARVARGAAGFASGAAAPWRLLGQARVARGAVRRAMKNPHGAMLSPKERAAVKGLLGKARFADVAPRLFGSKATRGSILGTLGNAKGTYDLLTKNRLSHSFAKSLNEPLKSGWRTGIGALGVGAAVGGGGASVQYSKGRGSEKRFQRRLAMNKLSSVQDAALWSSFDLEISKISGAKNIAYGAGKSVRAIVDALDKLKQGPSGLYRSYAKGYHKVPRNIKDVVTKGKEAVPAAMLLIPGAAGVGAAVGAYAKSKLKRKEEPADAFAHRGYSEPEYGEGY